MPDVISLWQGFVLFMDSISLWVWYVLGLIVMVGSVRWIGHLMIESHHAYDDARLADLETIAREIQAVRQAVYDLDASVKRLLGPGKTDSDSGRRELRKPDFRERDDR